MDNAKEKDILTCAINAHATLTALYQWREMVREAGGTTSISGIAKAHAMFASMDKNKGRFDTLITEPLQAAIEREKAKT